MKHCGLCNQTKNVSEFWANRTKKDGRQTHCKKCSTAKYGKSLTCEKCEVTFWISHRNVKARKTSLCRDCAAERSIRRLIERNKKKVRPEIISTRGYQYLRDSREKNGYVFGHRKILENQLGRRLRRDEVVHHIDGERLNNDISNLWLTNNEGHRRAHRTLELIAYDLLRQGKIVFNRTSGEYEQVVSVSQPVES